MNMREKVARAFYEQRSRFTLNPNKRAYDELDVVQQAQLLASAAAILDALYEPDEAMVEAGMDYRPVSAEVRARDCWQAMITQAKAEG